MNSSQPPARPFTLTRTFDAPRHLVWRAWTERDQLMRWFGPKGVTISTATLDFRPRGVFHYCMRFPDGNEIWGRWLFREIAAPERIVWINAFSDPFGQLVRPPFAERWPAEMLTSVTFEEVASRTRVTLQSSSYQATPDECDVFDRNHESMRMGWTGTFDQLEAHLAAHPSAPAPGLTEDRSAAPDEIVLVRTFEAPREVVWGVWTDPHHLVQWWGPAGFSTEIETMDVRPGGVWRHVMIGPDGTRYPNSSIFTEVVRPERVTYRHGDVSKGRADAHFTATWTFEDLGPQTRVTIHMKFPSAEERDHVVRTYGAIQGGTQTLARLAEQLKRTDVR